MLLSQELLFPELMEGFIINQHNTIPSVLNILDAAKDNIFRDNNFVNGRVNNDQYYKRSVDLLLEKYETFKKDYELLAFRAAKDKMAKLTFEEVSRLCKSGFVKLESELSNIYSYIDSSEKSIEKLKAFAKSNKLYRSDGEGAIEDLLSQYRKFYDILVHYCGILKGAAGAQAGAVNTFLTIHTVRDKDLNLAPDPIDNGLDIIFK